MKAGILTCYMVSVISYYTHELMKYQNKKSKDLFFDKYLFNFIFSITIVDKDFKFCFPILQAEGTMSQILYSCLGFYFM